MKTYLCKNSTGIHCTATDIFPRPYRTTQSHDMHVQCVSVFIINSVQVANQQLYSMVYILRSCNSNVCKIGLYPYFSVLHLLFKGMSLGTYPILVPFHFLIIVFEQLVLLFIIYIKKVSLSLQFFVVFCRHTNRHAITQFVAATNAKTSNSNNKPKISGCYHKDQAPFFFFVDGFVKSKSPLCSL